MPFEKGNRANPGGRPKTKLWADALRVSVLDAKDDKQKLRTIAEKVVDEAMQGNMSAVKEIGDRLDGKPAQTHEGSGDDGEFLFRMLKYDDKL